MSDTGVLVSLADEDAFRSRVVLDYTSRDFTAIRAQLVGLARGLMPEWETAGEASDFGTLLLELFAYMGDVMHFYIDRTASEAFLGTAVRRQSVLYIADMLGYTPIGQQGASVEVDFVLDPNAEAVVTIPVGARIYNETNDAENLVVFELNEQVILDPLSTPPVLTQRALASEGITVHDTLLGVSKGAPNSEFLLPNRGIIFNTVSVRSDEAGQTLPWTFVTDISLARPTQAVFTTFLDDQSATHVVFGDNAAGRIPPYNADLYVTYRYGVGARANDLAPGSITSIASSTVPGVDLWGVTVTNPASPLGGTDPESVEAMRYSIPRAASRIKSRAVTLNDYADLALQVPGVAKSVAHGTVYTMVHVRIAPQDGVADATYMKKLCDQVEDFMKDKIIVGSSVHAEPEDVNELWQDIYIQITVHVTEGYNRTSVRLQVESVVRTTLAFNAVDFGTRVSIGRIYRTVLAVQGVDYAELTWLSTRVPVDDTNPDEGDTITTVSGVWQHDGTLTTTADPGSKHYRRNSTTNPTQFAFSITDDDNIARDFTQVHVGDHVVYRPMQSVSSWMSFVVTAAPTISSTWVQVNVAKIDEATTITAPGNNDKVLFSIIRYTPTPDSLGGVNDIATDELLIPRITPFITKKATVSNVALTTNVATLTTSTPHGMIVGDNIDVTGTTPSTFSGSYVVTTVPTTTTLTYDKTNANIASVASAGTVTTINVPESEIDYPDLDEAERTHDGLWVKAVGGVPGT